jgi:hypothetical protein
VGNRSSGWPSAGTLRVERWQLDLLADRDHVNERANRAAQAIATMSEREDPLPKKDTFQSAPAAHHPAPRQGGPRTPRHVAQPLLTSAPSQQSRVGARGAGWLREHTPRRATTARARAPSHEAFCFYEHLTNKNKMLCRRAPEPHILLGFLAIHSFGFSRHSRWCLEVCQHRPFPVRFGRHVPQYRIRLPESVARSLVASHGGVHKVGTLAGAV